MTLSRRVAAEFLGTGVLLAVVVGSGIMGERLSGGNDGIALLANSLATGAGLLVLIYGLGPISGAHINPAVTISERISGRLDTTTTVWYVVAQLAGAGAGVITANLMFDLPAVNISDKLREGPGQVLGEVLATFLLVLVIRLGVKFSPHLVGALVACFITAAYWFTSSTSFANPAVTVSRTLSNTFAGISPDSVPFFVVAEMVGAVGAVLFADWLLSDTNTND